MVKVQRSSAAFMAILFAFFMFAPGTALAVPDPDRDGDGVVNGDDNCHNVANPLQENNDVDEEPSHNPKGDACDNDDDNDDLDDQYESAEADEADDKGSFDYHTDSDPFDADSEVARGSRLELQRQFRRAAGPDLGYIPGH